MQVMVMAGLAWAVDAQNDKRSGTGRALWVGWGGAGWG